MEFYTTGQIEGKFIINTSPNGGVFFLSPSSQQYDLYKKGELEYDEYIKLYLYKMRKSYETNRDMWDWIFKNGSTFIFGCDYRQTRAEESHLPTLSIILQKLGGKYLGHLTKNQLARKGWITHEQII